MASIDSALEPILARYRRDPSALLQILRDAQDAFDWISPEFASRRRALNIPATRVDSVTQFYAHLFDEPRGQYRVLFSDNITDRMADSPALMAQMLKRSSSSAERSPPTASSAWTKTSCTGMCDQGPALLVNNRAITRLTLRRIDAICALIRAQSPARPNGRRIISASRTISSAPTCCSARPMRRARLCARRWRCGARRHDRGNEEIQPARTRRSRLHHRR